MTSFAAPTRLIAIDIDGTLLPTSGLRISERNREALLRAEAEGVHIVVATGRRQAYAIPVLELAGLSPETVMISSNGTVTRTFSGRRIDRWLLPVETARALCGELRQFGGRTVFTFDREGPGELVVDSLAALETQSGPVGGTEPALYSRDPSAGAGFRYRRRAGAGDGLRDGRADAQRRAAAEYQRLCRADRDPPHGISGARPFDTGYSAAGLLQRRGDRAAGARRWAFSAKRSWLSAITTTT